MKIREQVGLTFDDVLLVPQYTDIKSRKDVSLKTRLTKDIEIETPVISSNMDTITEINMMKAMSDAGGVGILHRFMPDSTIVETIKKAMNLGIINIAFSIGIVEDYIPLLEEIKKLDPEDYFNKIVTIDVAHGACGRVVDAIKHVKEVYNYQVIAGNVATADTTRVLCEAGADSLKVGIGNGGACLTRKIAGAGVPLLSSLIECSQEANKFNVPIICDGGIKNSGDAVKALAAGASTLILGSMLSGTVETPGEIITKEDGTKWKLFRGMASASAMRSWRGDSYKDVAAEGIATHVPVKCKAKEVVSNICAGIRSGMTYSNSKDLQELRERAIFTKLTALGYRENGAHILDRL